MSLAQPALRPDSARPILKSVPTPLDASSRLPATPLVAGIVTGQLAGLIMAVAIMAVFTLFLGHGPLYPVQVIGSSLLGEGALDGLNLGAVLAGLLVHQLGPTLFWGAAFGALASKLDVRANPRALLLGLGLGVVAMVDPYFLVPAFMTAVHGTDIWNREVPMFWDWAAHLAFGASFALYPWVQTKLAAREVIN